MPVHAPVASSSVLRELLLTRGLVRGVTARVQPPRIPTGIAALDALFGGGLPRGALTEVVGRPSSGRTTVTCALLRAVTASGALAACVDLPDAFDPVCAARAGIDLARVLWIRPHSTRDALQAAEHVLAAEGFGLVVVDLDNGGASRSVPASTWIRLTRAAARTRTAIVALGRENVAGTFAMLRIELQRCTATFEAYGPCPSFTAITIAVHLRKSKLGGPTAPSVSVTAAAES
jgi:hypothetical protein